MRFIAAMLFALAGAALQPAFAQDIPGRVGRLAHIEGAVSVYQDPDIGWDRAYVNTPITSENSVWTEPRARAEVRVGGIALRLDGETQLDVARLDDDQLDTNLQRGSVDVRVRYKERDDRITFGAPQALFTLDRDGRYRIDVDPDRDEARLTVFAGRGSMETSRGRVPVEPGSMVVVYGEYGEYTVDRAYEVGLDRWASARDRLWVDSVSRRYVSYDMTGYEELDRYGSWAQDVDYGAVWFPRVSSGWAPYRYGHWGYVRPWGWTWVDDAPWGYAPSHYGRWIYLRERWCWVPGRERVRPVWAPAVVGFIGGAGFSIGISGGSNAPVGWYPLAPWESYQPWYRANTTYITQINNIVINTPPRQWRDRDEGDWRQWNRDRGATVAPREVFVNRQPVQNSVVRVNAETIRQAAVVAPAQIVQQVLPQRNEVVRFREEHRGNVAAPVTVMRQVPGEAAQPVPQSRQSPQALQAPAQNQVVRPEFRRRTPPMVAPAPSNQPPQVSQPAQRGQPENPAARSTRESADRALQQQQREQQAIDAQRRTAEERSRQTQQQQANDRAAQEQARRQAEEQARQQQQRERDVQRQQQQANDRAAQEQARRQAEEQARQQQQREREAQRQQQQANDRAAQEQARRQAEEQARQQQQREREAQRQQQQANDRAAQEQARRQAEEQARQQQQREREAQRQQQQANDRAAQEQARRQAEEQVRQQQQREAAQREAQQREAQQRAAQEQARQQQREAQQQAQRQQQAIEAQRRAAEERARAQAAQQQQQLQQQQQRQQAQPQQAQPQQANPASRGERRGPPNKDKEKDKDEKDQR